MNLFILLAIGVVLALLLSYWYSRKNEAFGDGIALLCLLIARPFIVVHDKLKGHFPEPAKDEETSDQKEVEKSGKNDALHQKVNEIIGDVIGAGIGLIIIGADTYLAVVFNSSLFKTYEGTLSSGIFEWAAGLLWIATPAMFGIVALECAGIVKSSGIFARLHPVFRWIIGIISFVLMSLSIYLVMYAYSFRGVKIFDPTNTLQLAQMGEGILNMLGLLVGAASIPALIMVIKGVSTLFVIISFALLLICQLIMSVLDAYCLFVTGGEISVRMFVDKPLKVIVQDFRFPTRSSKRGLQAAHADGEQNTTPNLSQHSRVTPVSEVVTHYQQEQTQVSSVVLGNMQIEEPVFMEYSSYGAQNGNAPDADQSKKK